MTYANEAAKFGRIPTTFVECDMDFCANVYGNAPCTAAVGVTGAAKCYNTYATCQDKPHFVKTTKTYRFCDQNADLPVGISAIPLLKSVSFASQEITPGKGLGVRGSVSVRLIDAPFPDTEIDPYWRERTYDTNNQGTFWGKFKARNPFYENRVLRVRRGYISAPFSWSNFIDSVYVIEQLQGISKDDGVTLVAKDILKLADDKKALFPKPSNGRLAADITAIQTSFTLTPSGIGAEYDPSGKVAISGELMAFTRVGDVFTITRGESNTVAEAHKLDDTVQQVGIFDGLKVHDVIYTLLTSYSGINTGYINKPAWDAEASAHLAGVFSVEIPEPTGINTLVGELTEQGTCRVWWDEIAQLIQFRAIKPLPTGLPTLSDDSHFLTKSINVKTDTNQRISTVLIYFAQKKPTEKLDELKNYALRVATPNLEAISSLEYGSNLIKKVLSRWFKTTSQGRANALADALLKTYRDPPAVLEFNLTPALQLKVGDLFYAQTRKMQDVTGAIASVPMEVVYAQPTDKDDIKYKAQQVSASIPVGNTFTVVLSDALYEDLNLYDAFVNEYGIPEAGITVEFEILAGVLITGSTTASFALRNPTTWPSGCVIKLTKNLGVIAGRGGRGGNGLYANNQFISNAQPSSTATDGQSGGHAMLIEYPISINNQTGAIQGGAGGSGAGGSITFTDINLIDFYFIGGGGGSGGWPFGEFGQGAFVDNQPSGNWSINNGKNGNAANGNPVNNVTTVIGGSPGNGIILSNFSVLIAGDGGDTNAVFATGETGDVAQVIGNTPSGVLPFITSPSNGGIRGDAIHGNALITWVNMGTVLGNII